MGFWKKWSACAGIVLCTCAPGCTAAESPSIDEPFTGPDGLIAAEKQPADRDSAWEVTSGSLFRDGDEGWTGRPDDGREAGSTGSSVFRMVSIDRDLVDFDITMQLKVDGMVESGRTPAQTFDGAHIWVRYKSDRELYAVSVDRRDSTMIIKKKCVGGDENGGTYFDLNSFTQNAPIPFGEWQRISVAVRDLPDGSVSIVASRDGRTMRAIDRGIGCPPLRGGGGVGIRGDNAELRFDDIRVVRTAART